ncbi:MAG: hydantoinase/oxoprolinase family protein [Gammaproteobacteria bacterium]
MSNHALAVDVGGTFTDVLLATNEGLWTAKTSSVPGDPSQGFFDGADKVLARSNVAAGSLSTVLHGSTVATNAILEGKGARTGMLVTEGFRYVLEIGRAEVPRNENLYAWVKPERPVPPRRIVEVAERIELDGTVTRPLDERACLDAARALAKLNVEAVAVVFLHAYANPDHERRAAALLSQVLTDVEVAISSDVLPVFREYERSVATALNASVQPLVGRYIRKLSSRLSERRIDAPLLIMKSNGGVFTPEQAARQSVEMALSGPAAGVRGAAYVGTLAGFDNLITIDMGGTSADVSLVRDGAPAVTLDGEIGGYPLAIPIVDIHTIGAGGGSIAATVPQGGLAVGPRSAGAAPGPACSGQGGEVPTVTDANLVLGRIPSRLLDGEIPIDPALAERAIRDRIATPLGIGVHEAARGILAIVNNNMVGALKVVSVQKGLDPADFTLCAFGGAGPVHGVELFEQLGAARLLIPRYPGILCALGLLATDQQYDFARTRLQRAPHYDLSVIANTYAELEAQAHTRLAAEAVPPGRRQLRRAADLRYARQGVEITVEFPPGDISTECVVQLVEDFHALHERLYTFADREAPVEIVNLRITATGHMDKIAMPELASVPAGTIAAPAGRRAVVLKGDAAQTVQVYRREHLLAGHRIPGPAIVDQLDSTTVLFAEYAADVDAYGNLIVQRARSHQ